MCTWGGKKKGIAVSSIQEFEESNAECCHEYLLPFRQNHFLLNFIWTVLFKKMFYQLRNQKPLIQTRAAEYLWAAMYNTGNIANILWRFEMQNLTFLNQMKSLFTLKSSAPMALQFSCNDRHAYFNRNHAKKDAVVFCGALSILMVGEWWIGREVVMA